jgi:hypothetical protein
LLAVIDLEALRYARRLHPASVARLAAFVGLPAAPSRPELTEQWLSQVERACRFQGASARVHEMVLVQL